MENVEARLSSLGITLPEPPAALANYLPAVRTGSQLFLSGHLSQEGGGVIAGKVGRDLDVEQARRATRLAALSLLATAASVLGSLDRIRQVVRLVGMVNSTEDFTEHPAVLNGASDLLVTVFGDAGRHARSAFGVAQLPLGAAVELELILEVDDGG